MLKKIIIGFSLFTLLVSSNCFAEEEPCNSDTTICDESDCLAVNGTWTPNGTPDCPTCICGQAIIVTVSNGVELNAILFAPAKEAMNDLSNERFLEINRSEEKVQIKRESVRRR